MSDKIKIGQEGEEIAVGFLEAKGYQIIVRNFRAGQSEIDLIAEKDLWLVFVEVKLRSGRTFGPPEIFVNRAKRHNVRTAARQYLFDRNWKGNVRFDVIAISRYGGNQEVHHIMDAFH